MKNILVATFILSTAIAVAQDNIADMRANYNIGQSVTVTGIVTNGSELGSIRYIQDETAGIAIYPGQNWNSQSFTPQPGDMITVTGVISQYASLLEVGPTITSLELVSVDNALPAPLALEPNELNETYEGMLVQIYDAAFSDGGSTFGSSTYNFSANGQEGVIYVPSASPLQGELIPLGPVDIIGVLSQFSFDNPDVGYQVLPRSMDDLISENAINFTTGIEQTDLSTSSISLNWGTDVASNTGVFYGITPALGDLFVADESVVNHALTIGELESGMPYFCQVFSVNGADTAKSTVRTFATVSESSGDIKVYFNTQVDNAYSTGVDAITLQNATDDTLVAYIDRAMTTVDVAVYNNNNGPIVQALNNALDRGVVVRYIAEGQNANTGLTSLDPAIPVLERQNATSSGMHNKFVIIDSESVDSSIVITGSTNFTSGQLFSDPNNMIILQDQALARSYTIEFEEMWGGDGPQPDPVASRFGELKINNTPEKFLIGGKNVELYFSPSDGTTQAIVEAIETAEYDLDFALLLITNNILADAIIAQTNIFLTPRGIIETVGGEGSDFDYLAGAGVTMISHEAVPGQYHHKYAIIDHSQPESDPILITGSHNWTASAESVNDENTLIIHDATIANIYYQEFIAVYNGIVSGVEDEFLSNFGLYPNPAKDEVNIRFDSRNPINTQIQISDIQGKMVFEQNVNTYAGENLMRIYTGNLTPGIYIVSFTGEAGNMREKLVITR